MIPICPICCASLTDWPAMGFPDRDAMTEHMAWHATVDGGGIPLDIQIRRRRAATTALVLNASAAVSIVWTTPMPTADYQVEVSPDPALLGKVTWTISNKTTAGVTVNITAGLAVSASVLDVTAYQLIREA